MAEFDANNNSAAPSPAEKTQEKYSLRPRATLKREEPDDDHEDGWRPTTRGRSAKRRQKPKPLSRYRRKTANARERSRMREINEAFEALRRAVPHLAVDAHNEKLTKITTLRLAMKYISALSGLLSAPATALATPSAQSSCPAAAANASASAGRGLVAGATIMSSSSPSSSVPVDLAALGCLSPSTSDDVDSLLSEYATDLLGGAGSECSSAASTVGFLADHHSAAFLRDLPGAAAASYALSPSSCSMSATDVIIGGGGVGGGGGGGCFPSPLQLSADFPVDVAAAFLPFADHPLPPIDFNGDPYMFEDNFACTEFS
ncbi:Myc-type, basic helix-loop-helix (bHLH) domain [Cinara cedri]|uniref:Myc-type, basic helix-loop-helix (BHLH) domain n=1 Tax=Cinara cedri TaxID=506608 RepID=A0A5E4MBR9_9HEMI|nr:Myc-type, basic helix-loop-helix (bHLH) domain [Cinara cedri]